MAEPANAEAIEAWNGVLFDRFVQFRDVVTDGLGAHGEEALRCHPPQRGERVLDIGCGFGDTARRIAGFVGVEGEVLAIDAAERFVEHAREEAERAEAGNVRFAVADVEFGLPEGGFDLAFSRMGTMFFANPVAAMRNVRAALVPGGRLCMVVWRQKPDNEVFHRAELVTERFLSHPDQTDEPTCGPGPFSMANADTTSGILRSAGYEQIALRRCDIPIKMGDDLDAAVAYATGLGPAGELIRVNEAEGERLRPRIESEIRDALEPLLSPDGVWASASTWIVSAHNPG